MKDVLQDRLVTLLVALLEPDLRVSDDASGVRDVARSPVRVALHKLGIGTPEDRKCKPEFARESAGRFTIRVDCDGVDEEAGVRVAFVQFLEMNHLLTAERSVPREEADGRAVAVLATVRVSEEQAVAAGSQ